MSRTHASFLVLKDSRLTDFQKTIYGLLTHELDWEVYRPVKLQFLAKIADTDRGTAHRALKRLVELEYLAKGVPLGPAYDRTNTYRLLTPPAAAHVALQPSTPAG